MQQLKQLLAMFESAVAKLPAEAMQHPRVLTSPRQQSGLGEILKHFLKNHKGSFGCHDHRQSYTSLGFFYPVQLSDKLEGWNHLASCVIICLLILPIVIWVKIDL